VRIWMSTLMKPRSVTATLALSAAIFFAVRGAAYGLQYQIIGLRGGVGAP
jgi:hypothetical protein